MMPANQESHTEMKQLKQHISLCTVPQTNKKYNLKAELSTTNFINSSVHLLTQSSYMNPAAFLALC